MHLCGGPLDFMNFTLTGPQVEKIANALTRLASAAELFNHNFARAIGVIRPPNPTKRIVAKLGEETAMGIQILWTPPDINNEQGYSQAQKDEIEKWQVTPTFDGIDQDGPGMVTVGDKGDLAERTTVVPQGVVVTLKTRWIDNAGNPSLVAIESEPILSADKEPPENPTQGVSNVHLGAEVPD